MDFSLTENHREVEALAKQLLSEIASEERHRELDKLDDRFDAKAWKVLGESGLLAVWLDEAHGGAGMSLIEWAAIAEAVGRRAAAIPFVSASIAAMAIARFGSAAQQAAHLPGFAAGTHMLAYGNAGLRQVAPGFAVGCVVKTASGDQLTGYWTGIAGGMQAHALLLSALDEAGNTRLYIIPTAGLERTAQPGTSDETLAAVTLTDFAVTAEQELCGGEEALAQITELARLGNAAVMLGCASEALRLTGEYAKTRHQFEVPIGTFQAVQQRAGDGYMTLPPSAPASGRLHGVRRTARRPRARWPSPPSGLPTAATASSPLPSTSTAAWALTATTRSIATTCSSSSASLRSAAPLRSSRSLAT